MPLLEKSYQAFGLYSDGDQGSNQKETVNDNSALNSIVRARCDSLSLMSPDTTHSTNLENEEVLVDFFNVDVCFTPNLLLWKRSVGDSLEVTEANYVYLPLNINVQTQRILSVFQLKDRRILVVLGDFALQLTEVYIEYASALDFAITSKSSKICLKSVYDLVGINFAQNQLALYSHTGSELVLISFGQDSVEVINSACVSTTGLNNDNVKRVMFIHGSNELCLVTDNGLRTFSLSTQHK